MLELGLLILGGLKVPGLLRPLTRRSLDGVSIWWLALSMGADAGWLGQISAEPFGFAQISASLAVIACAAVVMYGWPKLVVPVAAGNILCWWVGLTYPWVMAGALTVANILRATTVAMTARRSVAAYGMSVWTPLFGMISAFAWMAWGLVAGNIPVVLVCAAGVLCDLASLTAISRAHRRSDATEPAVMPTI